MLAKTFEVHVCGEVPPDALDDFEYLRMRSLPSQTVLTGVVPDQAALVGLLGWLQSLGLEVTEVRVVAGSEDST